MVTVKGQIDMTASVVPSWPYPVPATRAQAQLNYIGPDCCNFVTVRSDQDYPTTGSFLAHVGSSYKIFGKYYIHTGTFAHNDFADLGSVDASARYFLWVDTPGAGYALSLIHI